MSNNNLNQQEEKIYKISDFPQIHQKYLELINSDSYEYIQMEEEINSDSKVCKEVINTLKNEKHTKWAEFDNLISNALDDFAEEGFINGYLQAKKENGVIAKFILNTFDELGIIKESIIKSQIIAEELQDYFNEDITTEENKKLILNDFYKQGKINDMILDYIDNSLNSIKELRKKLNKCINKSIFIQKTDI